MNSTIELMSKTASPVFGGIELAVEYAYNYNHNKYRIHASIAGLETGECYLRVHKADTPEAEDSNPDTLTEDGIIAKFQDEFDC